MSTEWTALQDPSGSTTLKELLPIQIAILQFLRVVWTPSVQGAVLQKFYRLFHYPGAGHWEPLALVFDHGTLVGERWCVLDDRSAGPHGPTTLGLIGTRGLAQTFLHDTVQVDRCLISRVWIDEFARL